MLGPARSLLISPHRPGFVRVLCLAAAQSLTVSASWTFRDECEMVPVSRNSQMQGQKDKGGVHGQWNLP